MRHKGAITSVSWIPAGTVEGSTSLAFEVGFVRGDPAPPVDLNFEEFLASNRFRFVNLLSAWIEVTEEGQIVDCGYLGGGEMGSTTIRLGRFRRRFEAVKLPDLRSDPEHGDGWVRFTQTVGGRTGLPAPRLVRWPPFVQWAAPLVWTTLSLTLHVDGAAESKMIGASRFPRHWVYDGANHLSQRVEFSDFRHWYRSFSEHSPWGKKSPKR